MPRVVFQRVYDKMLKRRFFFHKMNALVNLVVHPLQRLNAALSMMAYETSSDIIEEHCRLFETSAMMWLREFSRGFVEVFGLGYLRSPTATDLCSINHW